MKLDQQNHHKYGKDDNTIIIRNLYIQLSKEYENADTKWTGCFNSCHSDADIEYSKLWERYVCFGNHK